MSNLSNLRIMIQKVDCYSLFYKISSEWKFFHNGKSLVFKSRDITGEVSGLLKADADLFLPRLKEYLEGLRSVVGVEVKDGLYVNCEALGKFLMREGKKTDH